MINFLIGVTGSVAAIKKTSELVEALKPLGEVKIVTTKAGKFFLDKDKSGLLEGVQIYCDEEEWSDDYELGDKILHIELRRWAGCLIVAPLDANTLAKMANGICDNLLTSVVRAWDWTKPMILCPAMNTLMWENRPTDKHITQMAGREAIIVHPVEKRLACDDVGVGAMASIESIVAAVTDSLTWNFPLPSKLCSGIPINHHPGAFGFHRRKNHHTGVDLYCKDNTPVYAAESGRVVKIDIFTGPKLGHDWWEETWGVMIEGASGVINYGEVTPAPYLQIGKIIQQGCKVGEVKRVLFKDKLRPDIPGHNTSMLHLELYKQGTREFADWHNPEKNPSLLDPTPYLMAADGCPPKTLTWDNSESKPVG